MSSLIKLNVQLCNPSVSVSLIPKCPTINQIDFGSLTVTDDNNYQVMAI